MAKRYYMLVLWMVFAGMAGAEEDAPSLELLEFLAEGSEVDGEWMDPVTMNELTQRSTNTLHVESQGDE